MTPRRFQIHVLVALAILVVATGCNLLPFKAKLPPAANGGGVGVSSISGAGVMMDSWVWLGIGITVVGVFFMVFMKEGRLPLALVATGGAALGLVFVLKAVLPWIPWLIGGAIALGLLWLYARYHKKFKAMLLNGNGHGKGTTSLGPV